LQALCLMLRGWFI